MNKLFGHYIPRGLLFCYVAEILILATAIYLSIPISDALFYHNPPLSENFYIYSYVATYVLVMNLSMVSTGLYQRDLPDNLHTLMMRMGLSLVVGSMILFLLDELLTLDLFCIHTLGLSALFTFGGVISNRVLLSRDAESSRGLHRVMVIGTGVRASRLQDSLKKTNAPAHMLGRTGTRVVGYLDITGTGTNSGLHKNQIVNLGDKSLGQYARDKRVQEIIVALDERRNRLPVNELIECRLNGVRVTDAALFMERESGSIILDDFQPNALIFSEGVVQAIRIKAKRYVDILASLSILILATPIMLITAAAIWIQSGMKGSILYRQERVGLNGRTFQLLKFRSMIENAEKNGAVWAQKNDMRVTAIGRFIRKTRIDELPQLFNVLKGDMSVVGPRPERPEFVRKLEDQIPYYNLRHYVMPGITGWAQICFPYGASVEDSRRKLEYDLYYIKNYSVVLDILILLQTISVILLGKGAR